MKWRRARRADSKKNAPAELNIEDVALLSKDMLKNKL